MKPTVLWVEDSARLELANLCGPVYFTGACQLTLAENVTTGVELLTANAYHVLIVDVRLPPGSDPRWLEHYRNAGSDKVDAQLGLKLLHWLITGDPAVYAAPPPAWVDPARIGVFTVESRHELSEPLERLGITTYQQKVADLPDTVLNDMIMSLLERTAS